MKIKLFFFLSAIVFFQSCVTLHEVNVNDLKIGANYDFKLVNAKKSIPVTLGEQTFKRDTFFLEKKGKVFKVPQDRVASIKRKKFSILKTGITLTLVTVGAILYVDQANEDTLTERIIVE